MNNIKTILFIIVLSTFFIVDSTFWAFWVENINDNLVGSYDSLDTTVQNWIIIILWFLWLIWAILIIYAWFMILTAAGNDEQIQKWKKTITYTLIWIVIIFSAWLIVNFLVWSDKIWQEQQWILE